MRTQDLVPMIIDPFGQAARHALAMQSGSFEGGTFTSNGSAGRGVPADSALMPDT